MPRIKKPKAPKPPKKPKVSRFHRGKATASRSGYEGIIKLDLESRGIAYEYETESIRYTRTRCPHCSGCVKSGTYTPDFIFKRGDSIYLRVETKGRFASSDRTKILTVIRDNPALNLRILFQADNLLGGKSKSRYTDWARKHNIIAAVGNSIPDSWIRSAGGIDKCLSDAAETGVWTESVSESGKKRRKAGASCNQPPLLTSHNMSLSLKRSRSTKKAPKQ